MRGPSRNLNVPAVHLSVIFFFFFFDICKLRLPNDRKIVLIFLSIEFLYTQSHDFLLDLSDMEFLDDSSTESLLLSGDEYNQDFDSTNFEESQDEDDALNEIVRCICELDEENGFMIQVKELGGYTFHINFVLLKILF